MRLNEFKSMNKEDIRSWWENATDEERQAFIDSVTEIMLTLRDAWLELIDRVCEIAKQAMACMWEIYEEFAQEDGIRGERVNICIIDEARLSHTEQSRQQSLEMLDSVRMRC